MLGKKIVVTGANGMLGSAMMHAFINEEIVGIGSELDITNREALYNKLKLISPDIIIHTAAYTDVDGCEKNPKKAYLVNTLSTQHLVDYCIDKDILFIYISSTGIYGSNKKEPYIEFDNVEPLTIHHKSKFEGEKVVQNHLSKYLIIRTGWLYGGDITHGKNFVYKRYLQAKQESEMFSDNTQIGNPTYVVDVIKQISLLIERSYYGLFNCVNTAEDVSRYTYVKKIVKNFDVACAVKVAPLGMFTRVAPVSENESARNYKLDLLGCNIMRPWDEALAAYIETLKEKL